jgi:hypothetical protein
MKAFFKIFWIITLIVLTSNVVVHAQLYVKKDTTMTFNIEKLNAVQANYTWTLTPSIPGFVSNNDTTQTVKWTGNTDSLYTLTIIPAGLNGCNGDPKSLMIRLYDTITKLPIKVAWDANPVPQCAVDPGGSVSVDGVINITGYSGSFTVTYKIDTDTTETGNFDTSVPTLITFNRGWNNTSSSTNVYHYVRITRIVAGTITQLYDDADAPLLTITIKPLPKINEIGY